MSRVTETTVSGNAVRQTVTNPDSRIKTERRKTMANTTTLDKDTKFLAEMIQELKTIKSETARRDILNIAKGIVIGETPRKETAENDALSSQ